MTTVAVDASGTAFPAGPPRRRIVSLVPSTTELLCDLGLADALVAVTAYCVEPADVVRARPRIGGTKDPDLERIRALAPDLVVANIEENLRAHVETLRSWGIPVWVTYPRTVAGTLQMIGDLGDITGARAAAARLRGSIEPVLARVRAGVAGRPPRRVFYAIWRAPYMTVNGDTYISDVLATGGAENVFAGHADRYPVISLDDVAARRPEVILLPDEPFRFRRAHLADFAPYAEIPAVRDGRVRLVDGKAFSWHGRRILDALAILPDLLTGPPSAGS